MLLQILGTFEGLAAKVTLMWLERDMDTNVRSDVVTFYSGSAAITPLASQVQVVGALASNMTLANVILDASQLRSGVTRCIASLLIFAFKLT